MPAARRSARPHGYVVGPQRLRRPGQGDRALLAGLELDVVVAAPNPLIRHGDVHEVGVAVRPQADVEAVPGDDVDRVLHLRGRALQVLDRREEAPVAGVEAGRRGTRQVPVSTGCERVRRPPAHAAARVRLDAYVDLLLVERGTLEP